jgi:uncharacterized protein involved in exopolysaccharide biosynthesis
VDISIYQVLWNRRRLFFGAMLAPLLISVLVIYLLPRSYSIKSSIEIASVLNDGKVQPIEPADLLAKRAIDRYLPEALLKLEAQGVESSKLAQLQYLRAEPSGREVILVDTARGDDEKYFRSIQQAIIDLIVHDHGALINNYRNRLSIVAASAKRTVQNLDRQLKDITDQLATLTKRTASHETSLEVSQDTLSKLILGKPISDTVTDEAQIRELRERIASIETVRRNDDELKSRLNSVFAELQQAREEKLRAVANAEQELEVMKGTTASLAPSRIPLAVGTRKILLLLSAAVASVAFALFVVLIVDRAARDIGTPVAPRDTESVMGLRKIP